MGKRLSLSIGIFFIFLILFITIILISEYRNMDRLKIEYPNIPKETYDYRKSSLKIWAINLMLKFLVPLLFLTTGLSKKIGSFAESNGRNLFLTGIIYVILFSIIDLLISLPTNFYGGFILKHRYDLSNQTLFRWLELTFKSFALNTVVFSLFIWFPYYLIYRNPTRWWLYLGLLSIPVFAFITFISPMYIDPIYNKYTSIEDEELGKEIKQLLKKAEIEDAEIYKVDKSRDTKEMNAYMTGVFKSKRIVLWDTTMEKLDKDEVLSVTAHEIGHYIKGHIWKSIILGGLFSVALMYLVYRTSNWILINSNGVFGFNRLYDIASIPLIILVLNFYMFFANPIINFSSRQMEREADMIEIQLTKNKEAAISTMLKLYEGNLSIPRPSKLFKIWYHSHPTAEERIKFFTEY
ncbi:M48 family metallopeptidase [Schnuerera ultunensis]|uniref:Peptidase, M48 family n=1 Tax=[Clostridium] ultunense Esp TaxID=1288971 RepID=A0A1M4PJC3_9FIRM|nr:M48 family metallopeptidase [Schnuerera ultunensis]SHD75541.1 Peptidase, M48 family [[Clostridium] ultunense Esp]